MDLSFDRWERSSSDERDSLCRALAAQLPSDFSYHSMHCVRDGERLRETAHFQRGDSTFALIPGGPVELGFDLDRPWTPTKHELSGYSSCSEEYDLPESIHDYLARVTLRPRTVALSPHLIETAPSIPWWREIPLDDPRAKDLSRKSGLRAMEQWGSYPVVRIRDLGDGKFVAELGGVPSHAELTAKLSSEGFRLPTSDEWEYACGAGNPTLYRWGDHAPSDREPRVTTEQSLDLMRRMRIEVAGNRSQPEFPWDWELHRRPNVLGITMASITTTSELTADTCITRGGDGGCFACGGAAFFFSWLTLATAYFDEQFCARDPGRPNEYPYHIGRRVFPLD